MAIPYRTKRTTKRLLVILLVLAALVSVVLICWSFWLGRFVVYSRSAGAYFDFDRPVDSIGSIPLQQPADRGKVTIYYNEGENEINKKKELTQMTGYYVTTEELAKDIGSIMPQVQNLEPGTPVMVDVKSIYGNFFYSSTVSADRNTDIDTQAMDQLLKELDKSGAYTIARLPALRDFNYGLNHVNDGLPTAGGYLWMDDARCYWLNPASQGTISYLVQIITELRGLGFDEVVLYDFYFPETDGIVFNGDKELALTEAAATLVATCASDYFTVSFVGKPGFPLPESRSRLYVEGAVAAEAAAIAQQTGLENPSVYLVFLTDLHDTRFNEYSVLRPLSGAH